MHATTPTAPPTNELQDLFGDRMVTGGAELDRVSRDESRAMPEGAALAAVFPESTEEVSAALGWANRHGVKVSVRGTGTGVSGGALAYAGGLVVSLERMNRIMLIDPVNRLAEVQAGVINAELDRAAEDHGLSFAPDPASAEISTIGGNIATNAGGLRCISHGVTRDSVAALEVVLADGSILRTGARTRKNVVGLDLTSLFVGSEGTLGVITSATVRLKPIAPGIPRTFRASFPTVEDAGRAVTAIVNGAQTPEVLELLDARSVQIIETYKPSGLPADGCALLIGQFTGLQAEQAAGDTAQLCREHGAREVVIAEGESLLEARRLANPALNAQGLRVSCDVAVPVGELAAVFRGIERIAEQHGRTISVVAHAGDGNLHPTVEAEDTPQGHAAAEVVIGDITRLALKLGGTISGEHGIGLVKQAELPWQLDEATLHAQQMIKYALDRKNILTPGRGI
ncbi:FAD-binding oxidoreductase [Glutamicibacter protophormiae]|uniref:Glycolate oxidase n=1 Tax=Glutamicibacter protophormiae TaxID=37930 RepID=A0ABS4XLM5_GLUPR|nr:FAD-linked oxidase C-terminal domain-containing protein [Glutamicibacter protophormiae]MBP2397411.1 glycolate oxidase [Glutamicibacter protophormiae]GGL79446.1 glycolate oxidase [Glutamicibacter protophormiae]